MILNWGFINLTSGNGQTYSITYSMPFSTTTLNIDVQMIRTAGAETTYWGLPIKYSMTNSGFTAYIHANGGETGQYYWKAIGY